MGQIKHKKKNPKMKTNRSAAKRFSKTASGLVKFGAKAHRHGLSNKSRKLNRNKKRVRYMAPGDAKRVARQIPYL
jgi:large subunit ribosomal protein L35